MVQLVVRRVIYLLLSESYVTTPLTLLIAALGNPLFLIKARMQVWLFVYLAM